MFLSFQAVSVDCFKNLYSLPKKKKKRSEAVSATLLCLVALIKIVVISC